MPSYSQHAMRRRRLGVVRECESGGAGGGRGMAGVGELGTVVFREPLTLLDFGEFSSSWSARCHNLHCKLKQTDQSLANYS